MKEVTAKRKEGERQERIQSILRAGGMLFLKKGYVNTTMRDICAEAELSTGAVYFYFSGKEEIYTEICVESLHILLQMLEAVSKNNEKSADRIFGIEKAVVKFYTEHRERWKMLTSGFRNVGLAPDLLNRIEEVHIKTILTVEATVSDYLKEKKIDNKYHSREITMGLWAIVEGLSNLQYQGHFVHTKMSLGDLMDLQVGIYLEGL
jgi:AcrR family transcriptional regulator